MNGSERDFQRWLRRAILSAKLSDLGFARRVGVGKSTVSQWVTGRTLPKPVYHQAIAEALGVTMEEVEQRWRQAKEHQREIQESRPLYETWIQARTPTGYVKLPLLGLAPADSTRAVYEDESTQDVPYRYIEGLTDPAAVIASGNCLRSEQIESGDIVIIDRAAEPKSGDIVVMVINGEQTMKKWYPQGDDWFVLVATDPGYDPIIVRTDRDEVRFIGVAKGVHSYRPL